MFYKNDKGYSKELLKDKLCNYIAMNMYEMVAKFKDIRKCMLILNFFFALFTQD